MGDERYQLCSPGFQNRLTLPTIWFCISYQSAAVVQLLSRVRLLVTPWTTLSLTISWSLPKLISIKLVMPSNHLILCRPLPWPSVFPSITVFSNGRLFPARG